MEENRENHRVGSRPGDGFPNHRMQYDSKEPGVRPIRTMVIGSKRSRSLIEVSPQKLQIEPVLTNPHYKVPKCIPSTVESPLSNSFSYHNKMKHVGTSLDNTLHYREVGQPPQQFSNSDYFSARSPQTIKSHNFAIYNSNIPSSSKQHTIQYSSPIIPEQPRLITPSVTQKSRNTHRVSKPCNCSKSQCLKLYCECFAKGQYCRQSCNCRCCFNTANYETQRQRAIKQCLERNPDSFKPKIHAGVAHDRAGKPIGLVDRYGHRRGCNCRRSGCLKNYCECYQASVFCTDTCNCKGCKNFDPANGHKHDDVSPENSIDFGFSKSGSNQNEPCAYTNIPGLPPLFNATISSSRLNSSSLAQTQPDQRPTGTKLFAGIKLQNAPPLSQHQAANHNTARYFAWLSDEAVADTAISTLVSRAACHQSETNQIHAVLDEFEKCIDAIFDNK